MNNGASFISGLEELVARIVSLFFSVVFFAVYSYAGGEITVNWQSLISYLLIFWLVYEGLSYVLYIIFKFFGDNTPKTPTGLTIPIEDEEDTSLPANGTAQSSNTGE
jgi:Na+(H+)/acetate symporter ActP